MIIKKTLSLRAIFRFTDQHLTWLIPWMLIATSFYYYTQWKFIIIPWLPLAS
jgi:putative membrane protein